MRVKIANKVWGMNTQEFKHLLDVASAQVPCGIYAAVKDNYAELLNIKCKSKSEVKRQRQQLKQQGYKVYCNG